MAIEKKKYIDSDALQYLLGKLRDKNKDFCCFIEKCCFILRKNS